MVNLLDAVTLSENLFPDMVEIFNLCREPRDLHRSHLSNIISDDLELGNSIFDV